MSTVARITNDKKLELYDEVIEYPAELEGGRNYFVDYLMLDVGNYERIGSYYYYTINNLSPSTSYMVSVREDYNNEISLPTSGNRALRINNVKENNYANIINVTVNGVETYNRTIQSDQEGRLFLVSFQPVLLDEIYSMIQLEKGNKATDWTPAPEDLGYDFPPEITSFKPGISSRGILLTPEIIEDDIFRLKKDSFTVSELREGVVLDG